MNKKAEVRRKLERTEDQKLPEFVWEDQKLQEKVEDYLGAPGEMKREEAWEILEEEANRLMGHVKKALEGVSKGPGAALEKGPTYTRGHKGEEVSIAPGYSVSPKTDAMLGAMSELFAGLAHRIPEVVVFREDVIGRFLTQDEAHALLASPAARMFPPEWFAEWEIPIIGHSASIEAQELASSVDAFDHRVTVHVTPPGVTKKVRYAGPRLSSLQEDQEGYRTRCMAQGGAPLPPVDYRAAEQHGEHWYPQWLWPGSVVGNLFDLSDELVNTFDWPADGFGQLATNVGAWFVLTGEAPDVRPINARWEQRRGKHLALQWRIRLVFPPGYPKRRFRGPTGCCKSSSLRAESGSRTPRPSKWRASSGSRRGATGTRGQAGRSSSSDGTQSTQKPLSRTTTTSERSVCAVSRP